MKIVIIYAHPVPESLNRSLLDVMVKKLESSGHSVRVSDLYAMAWKAVLDGNDFLNREPGAWLDPMRDSKRAHEDEPNLFRSDARTLAITRFLS